MTMFRLVLYDIDDDDKSMCGTYHRHEYLGSDRDIWVLWFLLFKQLGKKHVEVYSLDGRKQEPAKGVCGLIGHSV